ncbi:TolC family protein, partial [Serratia entomophila]
MSRFKGKIAGIALGGVALSVLFAPASALAIGVLDAYSLALQKDPTFLAALKEKEAGDENKNIGLAGLLPKVSLSYQNSPKNWQKVTSPQ